MTSLEAYKIKFSGQVSYTLKVLRWLSKTAPSASPTSLTDVGRQFNLNFNESMEATSP